MGRREAASLGSIAAVTRRTVQIHPAALEEAGAAADRYMEHSRRAAERFLAELGRAIERVSEHPEQFPAFVFETRRMVLPKFPYVIVFRETASTVDIIAVAHGRRRPGYWRDRA
jgi:plasmid stabilization system protein ParE